MDIYIVSFILILPLPNSKQLDFNQILQKSYQQQRFSDNQGIFKNHIINMQAAVWFGDRLSTGGGRRRRQKGINSGQLAPKQRVRDFLGLTHSGDSRIGALCAVGRFHCSGPVAFNSC